MTEARPDIEKLNDEDLVRVYRVEKDRAIGKEVMGRLLAKVRLSELADEPLLRRSGAAYTNDDDRPLQVIDYLEVAGRHGQAEEILLNFVALPETNERFTEARDGIGSMIKMYVATTPERSNLG